MRALQAHRQLPALSCVNRRQRFALQLFAGRFVPAERDAWRNNCSRGQYTLDCEGETYALRIVLRQLVNDADEFNVTALPFTR